VIDPADVRRAAGRVLADVAADPRYAHTAALHVRVDGHVLVDEHLRGPRANDVFSVTKSVLATVLARLAASERLPDLDTAVSAVLPPLRGTPAAVHTWRHLLTMTRGAQTDGPWEVDAVTALSGGQVTHIALAPQLDPPGQRFRYDNGATHLLSAAVGELVGESVADFAGRELLSPLGIDDVSWLADPDGISFGYGHLRLSAADLGRIGQLWLDHGLVGGRVLLDRGFLAEMTRAHTPGGSPEHLPYGFLIWVDGTTLLAGGWAGQHLLVLPDVSAVVVTTGDPGFDFGPPPTDDLPADWVPALALVRQHLLPVLGGARRAGILDRPDLTENAHRDDA
jgi:CubicO group peptidase (beta-lactamase class C family)